MEHNFSLMQNKSKINGCIGIYTTVYCLLERNGKGKRKALAYNDTLSFDLY